MEVGFDYIVLLSIIFYTYCFISSRKNAPYILSVMRKLIEYFRLSVLGTRQIIKRNYL